MCVVNKHNRHTHTPTHTSSSVITRYMHLFSDNILSGQNNYIWIALYETYTVKRTSVTLLTCVACVILNKRKAEEDINKTFSASEWTTNDILIEYIL